MKNSIEKYCAKYLIKTKKIVKNFLPNSFVTLQFFQRKNNVKLCGINEVCEVLKKFTKTSKYKIKKKNDGDIIFAEDVVLELEGNYKYFGHLEGIIDGILSRQTSIATNAKNISELTKKEIIFMGDRSDHYRNQIGDGYAAYVGGLKKQVTDAHIILHDGNSVGTMPHALIQMFDGNVIEACKAYRDIFSNDKLISLVDFNNDVIGDSIKLLNYFGKNLFGVRVDTSPNVSDKFFCNDEEYGVTPNLIKKLREELDKNNGKHVKIIVSSGFNYLKIKNFEKRGTPVDIYGVGASILKIGINFTGDCVKINGKEKAKFGRRYKEMTK